MAKVDNLKAGQEQNHKEIRSLTGEAVCLHKENTSHREEVSSLKNENTSLTERYDTLEGLSLTVYATLETIFSTKNYAYSSNQNPQIQA